ncbi:MAG: hypothetical protein LBN31_07655, partial [Hungatella sp.]|nr:hypothetical protein [Hungatella sp.]
MKRFLAIFLTMLLIFNQFQYAYAEVPSITNDMTVEPDTNPDQEDEALWAESENAEKATVSEAAEKATEKATEKAAATEKAEKATASEAAVKTPVMRVQKEDDGVRNLTMTAKLAGTLLDGVTELPATNIYTAKVNAKSLQVNVSFTPNSPSKESTRHKAVITLENGLAFNTIPGMKKDALGNWEVDYDSLSNTLKTAVEEIIWEPSDTIDLNNGTVQPASGTLIYYFTDETISASLNLGVVLDGAYAASGGDTKTFVTPLHVTAYETVNGEDTEPISGSLKNYKVTGRASPVAVPTGYSLKGKAKIPVILSMYNEGYAAGSIEIGNEMFSKLVFTVPLTGDGNWTLDTATALSIPEDSGLYGCEPIVTVQSNIAYITFENFFLSKDKENLFYLEVSNVTKDTYQSHRGDAYVTPYTDGKSVNTNGFEQRNGKWQTVVTWLVNRNTGLTGFTITALGNAT